MEKKENRNMKVNKKSGWVKFFVCLLYALVFSGLFPAKADAAQKSYIMLYAGSDEGGSGKLERLFGGEKEKNIMDYGAWNVLPSKTKNKTPMMDIKRTKKILQIILFYGMIKTRRK